MRAPDQRSDAPCIHVAQMEDMAMRNFDLTPLWRSTVGFDRLFDLIDDVPQLTGEDNYPPYNIERTSEDAYRISLPLRASCPRRSLSLRSRTCSRWKAARPKRKITNTSIRGSLHVRFGVSSTWPTTSRSRELRSRMGF